MSVAPWTVIQSPTDAEMSAVQGAYLVADNLPLEDARLIAAAPDLLEALDLLLNDYVRLAEESGCDLIGSNLDPEVARARAALAKARGQ